MDLSSFISFAARLGLAIVFAAAAIGKVRNLGATRQATEDLGVPRWLAPTVAVALALVESVVAVGLVIPRTAGWAALAAAELVVAFSILVGVQLARGRRPHCNCFGDGGAPISHMTLVRNGTLFAMSGALAARWLHTGRSAALGRPGDLSTAQVAGLGLGAALAVVLAVMGWMLVQLISQRGDLLDRIERLEEHVGARRTTPLGARSGSHDHDHNHDHDHGRYADGRSTDEARGRRRHQRHNVRSGPGIGAPAPRFALRNVTGRHVSIDDLLPGDVPTVLIFMEPNCDACVALAKEIGDRKISDGPLVDRRLVAIVGGTPEAVGEKIDSRGFAHVLVDEAHVVAERYQVAGSPTAVVVLPDGRVASPLAEGRMAVSRLARPSARPIADTVDRAAIDAASINATLAGSLVLAGASTEDRS